MNKRVKRLWIKALRSGRFKQTGGQLCRTVIGEKFHCCLGVLEELAVAHGVIPFYNETDGALDSATRKWAGLDDIDPQLGPYRKSKRAATLNDDGKSFNYIADRIEKYL
jgi:hypothetical protein